MTHSVLLFRTGRKFSTRLGTSAAVAALVLVISGLVVGLILVHQPGSGASHQPSYIDSDL